MGGRSRIGQDSAMLPAKQMRGEWQAATIVLKNSEPQNVA
jgi:hypothetical protein